MIKKFGVLLSVFIGIIILFVCTPINFDIDDTTPPVIEVKGKEIIQVKVGENVNFADSIEFSAFDSVDGDLTSKVIIDDSQINLNQVGEYILILKVTDAAGNTTQKEITVKVVETIVTDTVPPVLTLKGDSIITILIGESYNEPGYTAIDNIDGDITSHVKVDSSGLNINKAGTYMIFYTVYDAAGNMSKTQRVIIVVSEIDTVPPVISLSGSKNMQLNEGDKYVEPGYAATDNVDGNITSKVKVDYGNLDTANAKKGSYTITYSVSDAAGNSDTAYRYVTVTGDTVGVDTIPPVITLKGEDTVTINAGDKYVEPGYTATDNNDGDLTSKVSVDYGSLNVNAAEVGNYVITYSVSDNAGNTGTAKRYVIVKDTTTNDTVPPVITLSGDTNMTMNEGEKYNEPGYSATDNKDGDITSKVNIDYGGLDVNSAKAGNYTITYSVSDAAGNSASARRHVTVSEQKDTIPPEITLSGEDTVRLVEGEKYSEPGYTATDNKDGVITYKVNVDYGSLDTNSAKIGNYTIIYTVSDAAGNSDTAYRYVVVTSPGNELLLDNFESGEKAQNALPNLGQDDGWWYAVTDGSSKIEPGVDTVIDNKIIDTVGYNKTRGMYAKFSMKAATSSDYPWASIGVTLKKSGVYYDLSSMQQFKCRMKGSGTVRINFVTKFFSTLPEDDQWGHFGKKITLSNNWTDVVINKSDIAPDPDNSVVANKKWTDADCSNAVTEITFEVTGDAGDTTTVVEMYLDDIYFVGVDASVFNK